jgi:hypothetical protein
LYIDVGDLFAGQFGKVFQTGHTFQLDFAMDIAQNGVVNVETDFYAAIAQVESGGGYALFLNRL